MISVKERLKPYLGLAFCIIVSSLIAVLALNTGLLTEPEQLLPKGITMRSAGMSGNILRGIDLALEDVELIRSGTASGSLWRLLTFVHPDLFFYLALLIPAAAKTILLTGYYVRFGLCCGAMYYFLSEHLKLRRLPSAMLALMYAFSSQIIFTAQFASIMNMAVMLPVVMSSFDSYLQKRTWKAFVLACVSSFGLCASGGYGLITGVPGIILTGLLMCISLYRTFKMAFVSWLKLIGAVAAGLVMDMVFALPGLLGMSTDMNISESFKNARVTYTVFDFLRGTYTLRSGSVYLNGIPLFYIGILTVVAVLVFALNDMIPVRLKAAVAVVAAVIHITCCSSFVNETISVFGTSALLNSSKLICLEAVLFFAAGIGLKNASGLKKGDFIACGLIPLAFLILSNNSSAGTTLASPILISTFVTIIAEASLVYAIAKDKLSRKGKYCVLIAAFVLVGVNTAFVMFNNTIQSLACEEYFKGNKSDKTSQTLIFDEGFELPSINDNNYIVVPGDLSLYESTGTDIDDINYLSEKISGSALFERLDLDLAEKRDLPSDATDTYRMIDGTNDLVFESFAPSPNERLFAFCSSASGATLIIESSEGTAERHYTGPFLTEIESHAEPVVLRYIIDSTGEAACRISLLRLNRNALDSMRSVSGEISSSKYTVEFRDTNAVGGTGTVIFPYSYDSGNKIKINGFEAKTFDFCGKAAVICDLSHMDRFEVSVDGGGRGTVQGALISAAGLLCLIAIPVIQRYNDKKKVTGEGTQS